MLHPGDQSSHKVRFEAEVVSRREQGKGQVLYCTLCVIGTGPPESGCTLGKGEKAHDEGIVKCKAFGTGSSERGCEVGKDERADGKGLQRQTGVCSALPGSVCALSTGDKTADGGRRVAAMIDEEGSGGQVERETDLEIMVVAFECGAQRCCCVLMCSCVHMIVWVFS